MNRYVSISIDKLALYNLHRRKSSQSQFCNTISEPAPISQLCSYYPIPASQDITFNAEIHQYNNRSGTYTYPSQIKSDFDINNVSTGAFYEVDNPNKNINVILVHGWRMDTWKGIRGLFHDEFVKSQYNMYYFTLPYHFNRKPSSSSYSGEYMVSANIDRTLQAVVQAVTDLRTLIQWIRTNRKGKIVLIGVSLGGFISNLTTVLEDKIDALVSVFYANSIAFSVWNSIPGKYIKKDLELGGFSYEHLKQYWAITEPSNFEPSIKRQNILLMSGLYDRYVLGEDTDLLWKSWNKPRRIQYHSGHSGIVLLRKRILRDVMSFINNL